MEGEEGLGTGVTPAEELWAATEAASGEEVVEPITRLDVIFKNKSDNKLNFGFKSKYFLAKSCIRADPLPAGTLEVMGSEETVGSDGGSTATEG